MFGFRYVKSSPAHYLLQYQNGQVVREGTGLAFFYFAPKSTLVSVPLSVVDVPFMFEETTRDFQAVTLQGQLGYRIAHPKTLAQQQDFTLLASGVYASEDPERLPARVLNAVKAQFRALLQEAELREVLHGTEALSTAARAGLSASPALAALGIEVVDLALLAAKPTPDTARALEAPVREQILKQADDATYTRRNAAIAQEQMIRESELRSELVVEQKKRQVRETEVESERVILEKRQEIQAQELDGNVRLEERNAELVRLRADNSRQEAQARAFGVQALVEAMQRLDPRAQQALLLAQVDPERLIALGFQNLAENAEKIGEFNFSPDLLQQIAGKRK